MCICCAFRNLDLHMCGYACMYRLFSNVFDLVNLTFGAKCPEIEQCHCTMAWPVQAKWSSVQAKHTASIHAVSLFLAWWLASKMTSLCLGVSCLQLTKTLNLYTLCTIGFNSIFACSGSNKESSGMPIQKSDLTKTLFGTGSFEMHNYIFSSLNAIHWPVQFWIGKSFEDALMLFNGPCGTKHSAPAAILLPA